jgi:hypothetical protein
MIEDTPNIYEIDAMLKFCRTYKALFIYGIGEGGFFLKKYLMLCGIDVSGFIDEESADRQKHFSTGVLITGIADTNKLRTKGYKNIFTLSEYNRRTIVQKMRPRTNNNFGIEINITDHCNLNCRSCDHFSPIAKEYFLDLKSFENDMKRLAELSGGLIWRISIQGGGTITTPRCN